MCTRVDVLIDEKLSGSKRKLLVVCPTVGFRPGTAPQVPVLHRCSGAVKVD